jgi:hypothetical protein
MKFLFNYYKGVQVIEKTFQLDSHCLRILAGITAYSRKSVEISIKELKSLIYWEYSDLLLRESLKTLQETNCISVKRSKVPFPHTYTILARGLYIIDEFEKILQDDKYILKLKKYHREKRANAGRPKDKNRTLCQDCLKWFNADELIKVGTSLFCGECATNED